MLVCHSRSNLMQRLDLLFAANQDLPDIEYRIFR